MIEYVIESRLHSSVTTNPNPDVIRKVNENACDIVESLINFLKKELSEGDGTDALLVKLQDSGIRHTLGSNELTIAYNGYYDIVIDLVSLIRILKIDIILENGLL